MKKTFFICFLILISCNENQKSPSEDTVTNALSAKITSAKQNPVLENWLKYYHENDSTFAVEKFKFIDESKFDSHLNGTIRAIFSKDFNQIYKPFLVFNPSKTMYLDFDSYHWQIASDGNVGYEADQELNLINLKNKTVNRIAFYGPSYWIEEAYWKNDFFFVTLENSDDKVLFMNEYDLKTNLKKTFQYTQTLNFKSEYAKIRLQNHGIKVE